MATRNRKTSKKPTHESVTEKSEVDKKIPDEFSERAGIPWKRITIRFSLAIMTMVVVYFYSENKQDVNVFASVNETVTSKKTMTVNCAESYKEEAKLFPSCIPSKCGRVVTDTVVTEAEAKHLLKVAKAGLVHGGSNGGASILDLHSGALSKGDRFINIYKLLEESETKVFTKEDFDIYRKVKDKIHYTIAEHFGVPKEKLFLTSPTFFSRMTTKPAQTVHDEYWHVHTDKETYGSFHYTSLVYLSDYKKDFAGGRFIFVDSPKNTTVEPKLGRLSFFTSGSENPHFVEKLSSGTRYAITVSFTCDASKAINDPKITK